MVRRVGGAGGDDEVVVVEIAVGAFDLAPRGIDAQDGVQAHGDVALAAQDVPQRRGDVRR